MAADDRAEPARSERRSNRRSDGAPHIENEHALALLVEAVVDYAIFLIDADGRVVSWNAGAQRIKGYSADEIIGKHFSVFYPDEDRAADLPAQMLAAARRDGSAAFQGWRVRKDGSRFWADVVITPLFDGGRLYGYAKVTRDLTERRASEERERQLLAEQEARRAAEEALLARDRFLSIAAHELRTPVTTLRLSTDLLVRRRAAGILDEDRLTTGLARIGKASGRLSELVNELLDVSKLTAVNFRPSLSTIDLGDLVSGMVELYRGTHEGRRLNFEAEPGLLIRADASRIEQVVSNLIDNALKYSTAPSAIDIKASQGDDGVLLEVTDQGIGMDADALGALGEPFRRGANASAIEGLGLGLYISHGIVERHAGSIRIHSDGPGLGTTATVWLPLGNIDAEETGRDVDGAAAAAAD